MQIIIVMRNTFRTKVNNSFDFDINLKDLSSLDVIKVSKNKYHLIRNNKPFCIEILKSDFNKKQYILIVNNNKFEININDHLDQLINEMGFTLGSAKNVDSIAAPMPGLILEVHVNVGQEVKEDDPLLILEAMKMENVITSPHDGIIKSVNAIKGNTVEKGSLLIEFES